jgi:hypothetical protein
MAAEPISDADLAQLLDVLCDFAEEHGWPAPGLEAMRALARTLHRKLLENRLCNMFMQAFPNATVYGFHGVEGLLAQAERLAVRSYRAGRRSHDEFTECIRLCAQLREAGCVPSQEVEEEIDRLMRPASEDPEHQEWLRRTFTLGDYRPRPQAVTIGLVAVPPEDTTIALTDARYVMIGDLIDFGGEVMEVTANPDVETNTVAVARGMRGTVAVGHAPYTVGLLIDNTRTGREIIDPEFTVTGDAAERSRRVRENLDFTVTAVPPAAVLIRPDTEDAERAVIERRVNIDAAILHLEDETTAERARVEDITPPHLSRFARSVRAVIGTLGRVPGLAEARRWVAVDLRDGALTSESAAERLRLLDELAGE